MKTSSSPSLPRAAVASAKRPRAARSSLVTLHLVFVAPEATLEEVEAALQLFAMVRHTAPEYAPEIGLRALEPLLPYLSHCLQVEPATLPSAAASPAPLARAA